VQSAGRTFLPISVDSLRVNTAPPFDLFLRHATGDGFVLYCERHTPFTEQARNKLATNRHETLFIHDDQRAEYNTYLAGHLEEILADTKMNAREKSVVLYDCAQAVVEDVLEDPLNRDNIQRGRRLVRHTVNFIASKEFKLDLMLKAISEDFYLYTHSVNVVAYSIALAARLGITDRATLREIANGALLHDIGKARLPEELLHKDGKLDEEEWELIKGTTRDGYEMMAELGCVGEIALDIILHHHERLDGSGYPDHLPAEAISPYVRIVAIADVFDALTTDRHHQKARSTFDALVMMGSEMKDGLDQQIFRTFVQMMGNR
jgi:putative nucleotidyltransferase with HDIG domain